MEGRMTVCNMSIEAGARAGMIVPDETTFDYVRGRPQAPQGDDYEAAVERWRSLPTDQGAAFDTMVEIDADKLAPFVTWGSSIPGSQRRSGNDQPSRRCVVSTASASAAPGAVAHSPGSRIAAPSPILGRSCGRY